MKDYINSNPFIYLYKKSWAYASTKIRKKIILCYGIFFISNVIIALVPLLLGHFVNELQSGENGIKTALIYAAAYLFINILYWAIYGPSRVFERKISFTIGEKFLSENMARILMNSNIWYKTEHSGAINNRIRKAYFALRGFVENGNIYFKILCDFFFAVIAMVYFSPFYGIVAIVLGVISISINMKFDKPYVRALQDNNELEHKLMANLADNISNIRTIFTLRVEKIIHTEILRHLQKMFSPFHKSVLINEWRWFTVHMLVTLTYLVVIVGFVYQHYSPGETFYVGNLVALIGYVNHFTNTFYSITVYYSDVLRFVTDVQSVNSVEVLVNDKKQMVQESNRTWGTVNISSLSFSFREKNKLANGNGRKFKGVHEVGLSFEANQKIALVGESGSGKSTLLALLRGIYSPSNFKLTIDETEFNDWSILTNCTSLFPQDAEIFENSVLYNLTLGLPFSESDINEACEISCFNEVVQKLPKGLHSMINEKGVNLSGGEKQRLVLARCLLNSSQSSILLLDEPTSSLDKITAHNVYGNIMEHLKNKTIICSIHNYEFLSYFSYLYQINEGECIWHGPVSRFSTDEMLSIRSQ